MKKTFFRILTLFASFCLVLSFCVSGYSEQLDESSLYEIQLTDGSDDSVFCDDSLSSNEFVSDDYTLYSNGELFTNGTLYSKEELNLYSSDGYNYSFTYHNEIFNAVYLGNSWKIYDSYRIVNAKDMQTICAALSEAHPVYGRDYASYRTPSDMAYEWIQHNIAFLELPEGSYWREHARNVDLDPEDQGRSFKEIYEDRTGTQLSIPDLTEKIIEKVKGYLGL